MLRFGTVQVGQSETQLLELTNIGATSLTISSMSVGGSEFSVTGLSLPATVAAGQTVDLDVTFAPTSFGGTGVNLTFISNASNPKLQLALAGTGVSREALTATPSELSFESVAMGSKATLSIVLTNTRSWTEMLQGLQTVGSGFTVSGPTMPTSLSPGQSVTLNVAFTPPAVGLTSGSVFISGPALNIPLTGTGIAAGQLNLAPTTLNFGTVQVGSTTVQTSTITATGGSVTVASAASNSSQFAISGASFPLTLNAGQSVSFNVAFSPTQSGATSGALAFASNASNPQTKESLSGTGVVPTYSVNLSWSASTSSVAGYNVYRGASAGVYSKINSALDANTAYTDSAVASGTTYYYAATSVSSTGQESTYSSPIKVVVP